MKENFGFLRFIALVLSVIFVIASLVSCSGAVTFEDDDEDEEKVNNTSGTDKPVVTTEFVGYGDGVIGERSPETGSDGDWFPSGESKGDWSAETPEAEPAWDDGGYFPAPGEMAEGAYDIDDGGYVVVEPGVPGGSGEGGVTPTAGLLTAGEWRDAENIEFWRALFQEEEWSRIASTRALSAINVVTVKVVDADLPCFNVTVKLVSGQNVIYTARTDVTGCAYLFYNVNTDSETPDSVIVGENSYPLNGNSDITVVAADAGVKVKALDVMLMIDTTGSMSDELEYIKTELVDMVERIAKADEAISIRVSVNFYRDEGDDYVVRYYDFRTDINECLEQIKQEHAMGGGDYPEAVHTALDNAINGHKWRDEAVKICFLVLDAPPHPEHEVQGVNASLLTSVRAAAELGVRIVPVASSGVDTETEVLLRSFSVMTGGTYIFLTNHSGIGGDHLEATVGEYTVENLNNCMVRVVCEFCGIAAELIPAATGNNQQQQ